MVAHTTHFGFRTVGEEEKASLVRGVFDSVAKRYDIMNDAMSAGLHRLWKNEMVAWLAPTPGMRILDVAGGTGDIAFRILNSLSLRERTRVRELPQRERQMIVPHPDPLPEGEGISVTICDINQAMLEEGRNRAIDRNRLHGLQWVCGDAEALPLPDSAFDAYTIAFGIRNVTHIEYALKEAYRVLKPGGRFLCLEFSRVEQALLEKLYDAYSFAVIPRMGQAITGSAKPYQYLVESIRKFPVQETFAGMIREAGFGNVQYRNIARGVVAMHSGRRL